MSRYKTLAMDEMQKVFLGLNRGRRANVSTLTQTPAKV